MKVSEKVKGKKVNNDPLGRGNTLAIPIWRHLSQSSICLAPSHLQYLQSGSVCEPDCKLITLLSDELSGSGFQVATLSFRRRKGKFLPDQMLQS